MLRANGITIINFGMGSANAATIMDLLSAIQPEAVFFLGKWEVKKGKPAGRLYFTHPAAVRGEGTSNDYFPPEVPSLPAFSLLRSLSSNIRDFNRDYWTGTVYTTNPPGMGIYDDFKITLRRIRVMAVIWKLATLFTCGLRTRYHRGALLLVSDQPMISEGVKTDASDEIITSNYVNEHVI